MPIDILFPYRTCLTERCNRVRCEPGWHLGSDWASRLTDFDLWYVWAGRGRMLTNDEEIQLSPGVCLWMRPGRRYEATHEPDSPLGVNFFHFELRDHLSDFMPPFEVMKVSDLDYADIMMRLIIMLRSDVAVDSHAVAETLFGALLSDLVHEQTSLTRLITPLKSEKRHQEMMQRLANQICEYSGRVPAVAELARSMGYSVDYFSRVFTQVIGHGPQEFVIMARINRAKQLLSETSLSVGEISAVLGFRDVFFFSKQFRQKTGCTPTEFRAKLMR